MNRAPAWTLRALRGLAALAMLAVFFAPGRFMVDDAWFYLQIGRNLALGHGSTFDGTTFTNGYHPLWGWLVALVGLLVGGERGGMLTGSLLLQVGFATITLVGLQRVADRAGFAFPSTVVVAVLLTQITDKGWMSEGLLTAALHTAVLWSWSRADRPARTGLFVGLLLLARLDTAFFVGVLGLLTLREPRRLLSVVGVSAAVFLPWVTWTLITTGHVVPVSGATKSTFPVPDVVDLHGKLGTTGLLTTLGALLAVGLASRLGGDRARILGVLGGGAVLHAVYVGLFTAPRWSTDVAYYWITGTLATGLTMGELLRVYLDRLPSLAAHRSRVVAGLLLLTAGAGVGRAWQGLAAGPDPVVLLAEWIAENEPRSVLLVLDAPGRLAWFSGRPVLAADGLTQDYGFAASVRERGMPAVARERGVTHVVSYTVPIDLPWASVSGSPPVIRFVPPGLGGEGGTLRLGEPVVRQQDLLPGGEDIAAVFRFR